MTSAKPPHAPYVPIWAIVALVVALVRAATGIVLYVRAADHVSSGPQTYTLQGFLVAFTGNASSDF